MSLLRGFASDMPLEKWLNEHIWPAEKKWVSEEFVRDGVELAIGEMLRSGVTCFNDMYFFPEVTAHVASKIGIRACVGMIVMEFPSSYAKNSDEYIAKGLNMYDEYKNQGASFYNSAKEVLEKSDQVLPYLITHELGSSGLIYGLIGAGALAAAMSSADAITHGASVSFGRDVVQPMAPKISDRMQLMIMRIGVVIVGTAAYYLAIFGSKGLIDLLLGAYGSIVQFSPAVYGALFWRRGSRMGAIAGLVVGVAVNFYFQLVADSRPFDLHAGLLGLVANSVVFIVISLVTRVTPDHQAKADSFVEA